MTPGCQVWVEDLLARDPAIAGEVLEIGSLNVNGTIRDAFKDSARFPGYTGLDMRPGAGVDIVGVGSDLQFEDRRFGVVATLETLEHDERFWLTLIECNRVLRPGGSLIVTTRAFGFPRHDYPHDYWRFTTDGLLAAIRWAGFDHVDAVEDHDDLGVFVLARSRDGVAPAPPQPASQPALLPEGQFEMLRARMRALIPHGLTSMADAFERVDSDRRLLLALVHEIASEAAARKTGPLSPELVARIKQTIGS